MSVTVFHYPNCSTCKKARAWLNARGIDHKLVHIVDTPPSLAVLREVRSSTGLPIRKLFNTSGASYREGGFKDRLAEMTDDEALEALAADGKLIKRPVLIGEGFALVGFREAEYEQHLG